MWTMIEYCSSEEFEFKQDISLVVFNECYNVIAIRTAYRSCFDARNDEENYDFEVFLFQDNNLPEIKLFEPCFHQRRLWTLLYTFPFLFPFHFIIPYCYFVHGIKTYFSFFSIEWNAARKKKKRNPLDSNYKRKFSSNFPSIIVSLIQNRITCTIYCCILVTINRVKRALLYHNGASVYFFRYSISLRRVLGK